MRGFTLTETLLAMGVLVIGLVSVMALFPLSIKLQRDGAEDSQGLTVAQNVLSMLRAAQDVQYPTTTSLFIPLVPTAGNPLPAYTTDDGVSYDYRLAYRKDPAGRVDVVVFVIRGISDDAAQKALMYVDRTINPPTNDDELDSYAQLASLTPAIPLDSLLLAQRVTASTEPETYVVRASGLIPADAASGSPASLVLTPTLPFPRKKGEPSANYRVFYVAEGAVAVVMGRVR